jgi:hypothetical protein
MQALLSAPVMRKFFASGSASGNVSGGPPSLVDGSSITMVPVARVVPGSVTGAPGTVVPDAKGLSDASVSSTRLSVLP